VENQIAFGIVEDALAVAKILIRQNYVVLLSREENLTIVNYLFASDANRNEVVFMRRDEFEEEYFSK